MSNESFDSIMTRITSGLAGDASEDFEYLQNREVFSGLGQR